MTSSCNIVSQLRPLALYMQGSPLGYRSVSMLAKGEAEGLIYLTRSSLKVGLKLSLAKMPAAKLSVSAASDSGDIGRIKSGMKLILCGTSITFISIP